MATDSKKLERNRRYREKNREKLREWNRAYYQANREKRRESARRSREVNKEKRRERDREYYRQWRARFRKQALDILGGKCISCGFADWRGLQIDHINGGGTQERKRGPWKVYKQIVDDPQSAKEKYQVLCANCNQIKRYEQGEF